MLHKLYDTDKGRNGSVERILVKGSRTLTGTISRFRGSCELIPDSAFRFNIPIERGAMLGARNGDKVQAVLSSRPHRSGLTAGCCTSTARRAAPKCAPTRFSTPTPFR